jgi:glycosyltransferase involved in cell wall biosynthesis
MKTYALIPAYNEEKTIQEVINRIKKINKIIPVVVDDGSTDKTAKLAKQSGALVIKHKINKGKGEALRTGFNYILKNCEDGYVVVVDADLQYDPKDSIKLLKPLKKGEADFVTGYRDWSKVPFRHRLGNFIWRNSFNILFGTRFKDTNCGFMALTTKALKKIKRIGGGYIVENVLFIEALKNNLRIKQVPVEVKYKHVSKVPRGVRVVLGVLLFILKEGIKNRFQKFKIN